ncbi:MAG: DNA polymerase/3'-5' exonuclease PolX [Candidatus Omnitrophota bacterium]|nr:DNA polymerase/3'-5' exonuclease PolX [Candidatus Omnitrophota bacterium]
MKNLQIAQIFYTIAKILEIKNDNRFKIRAYDRGAQNIETLSEDIAQLNKEDRLLEIPGIGKDLNNKIKEYFATGKIEAYEELKKSIPVGLLDILNIPSVGPKTAGLLFRELKIKGVEDLEKKARAGRLTGLPGIKEKTVENILRGITLLKKGRERMHLAQAKAVADEFVNVLKKFPEVKKLSVAGSLRRMKETIRDIDILMISARPRKIMDYFVKLPLAKEVLARGETKSSILTKDGVQVDVRVLEEKNYGAALLYFTGSKNFNIRLRQLAIKKNLKINEYGIFSTLGKKEIYIAGKTEEEIFKVLGMDYVEPELREDNGEIESALKHRLPNLIKLKDIKGDLHCHSRWSDGGDSIINMAQAAKKLGYQYIAITDHSQGLKVANGVSIADLKKKKAEIDNLNAAFKDFKILYGTEVDIDSEGKLDYPDKVLAKFDIVVAAIHAGFKQPKEQLTQRIINALRNKHVDIIAHPTGILWGQREAYELDFEKVFKAARDTGTFLEINSFPNRLDLNNTHCRRAKDIGARIAISTDSHSAEQLTMMELGVAVARRGWLEGKDVINTLSFTELLKALKK